MGNEWLDIAKIGGIPIIMTMLFLRYMTDTSAKTNNTIREMNAANNGLITEVTIRNTSSVDKASEALSKNSIVLERLSTLLERYIKKND